MSKQRILINHWRWLEANGYKKEAASCKLQAASLTRLNYNVIGTYNLSRISHELNIERMILVSTDKAVRPTNIMGASKRLSELILQSFSEKSKCCFSMVLAT